MESKIKEEKEQQKASLFHCWSNSRTRQVPIIKVRRNRFLVFLKQGCVISQSHAVNTIEQLKCFSFCLGRFHFDSLGGGGGEDEGASGGKAKKGGTAVKVSLCQP